VAESTVAGHGSTAGWHCWLWLALLVLDSWRMAHGCLVATPVTPAGRRRRGRIRP
jgi:hypothetical protein